MSLANDSERRSRLKVGEDVPWVTSWSAEAVGGVGPCPSVGGRLALRQGEKPGFGRPIYSQNHFRRQRLSIRDMLCPLCGRPTQAGDRWSQTARRVPAGVLRARGLFRSAPETASDEQVLLDCGAIAPGHRACMERSSAQCPHLGGLANSPLLAFPDLWKVSAITVAATGPPGPVAAAYAAPRPPVAIAFLQLCGVTDAVDRRWRKRL